MASKRVEKPWGWELWLEQNDRYCYKRIFIKAGNRTSYQYHEKKLETNFIISGKAEVWLENDNGVVEKSVMSAGDFFTVEPPRKHRVIAITDIILQECSTPEVDDVIRIEDDANRGGGRIASEHINPAVCILAAGRGTRLEHLTDNINKALLPVNDKAVISHFIDLVPKEFDIVIALGFGGDLVAEYCKAYYPKRNFIFVDVDQIDGPGSGPGYSLSRCREHLQRPFYLVTADCIIDSFPSLTSNWLGVAKTGIPELYSTVEIDENDNIKRLVNKSTHGFGHAFIGFAGIRDFDVFWRELDKNMKGTGEVVSAFYNPTEFSDFKGIEMDWIDVGTIDGYMQVRENKFSLPKNTGECLYRKMENCEVCGTPTNGKCIKLFPNGSIVNKLQRMNFIGDLLPPVEMPGEHILSHDWVPGKTLYESDHFKHYTEFIDWAGKNLWEPCECLNIKYLARQFYSCKTEERLKLFRSLITEPERMVVNDRHLWSIDEYLKERIPMLVDGALPTRMFHGDLQFDNVIVNEETGKFTLIDWRDDFGGSTEFGDIYYDLAKLYGGMIVNYRLMRDSKNAFVKYDDKGVTIRNYDSSSDLQFVKSHFEAWVISKGFDLSHIRNMTGLIFLNMAPLHERPFADFLFYKAKEMFHDADK